MPRKTKKSSTSPKTETVTLSKEQFNKLLSELTKLREEVEILKVQKETEALVTPPTPKYYSLSVVEEARAREEAELEKKTKEKMNKAIELILKDYELNPPRHRA